MTMRLLTVTLVCVAFIGCKKVEKPGESKAAIKAAVDDMTIIRKGDLCFAVIDVPERGIAMATLPSCPASEWVGTAAVR